MELIRGNKTMTQDTSSDGFVYLVGAGPGDPSYITLRAVQCLSQADIVLYDYLVNPRILQHVRPGVECVCMGRHGVGKIWKQDEINAECLRLAQQGLHVVRLKGGDPAIFGRTAEEATALDAAGIPYEIVPGITAAFASGTCVGIPLTHRDKASAVALITGHERTGKDESAIDYGVLAQFPGTLVFYMGVTTSRHWTSQLLEHGMAPSTPVAIVRKISFPDQVTLRCTLEEVTSKFEGDNRLRPPAIVIVGDVVSDTSVQSWFESRPLFGQRILVTRAADQAEELAAKLSDLGAEVVLQPAIEVLAPENYDLLDEVIGRLPEMDWLVFSSGNGVRFFMNRLRECGHDTRQLTNAKIAVIGPGTAAVLEEYHLQADLMPDQYHAESLVEALSGSVGGKRVLLLRASRGRDTLQVGLQEAGAVIEQVVVYRSQDVTQLSISTQEALERGVDWITLTSSAIARSSIALLGEQIQSMKSASISPITSETARKLGFDPTVEATEHHLDGLIAAILEHQQ